MPNPGGQRGAALLTVLTVLVALGVAVSVIVDRVRGDVRPWVLESETVQALYVAESGIAYQLYLERHSDSSDPGFGEPLPADSGGADMAFGERLDDAAGKPSLGPRAPTDTFAFRMDSTLATPRVRVDRTRAFLEMTSTGRYRNTEVTLTARFGKALDDTVFGPALTLDNDMPVEAFGADRVQGLMRIRSPAPGMATLPWFQGFSLGAYTSEFTDRKYLAEESSLQKRLSDPEAEKGNGHFTPKALPKFGKRGYVAHVLGEVDLINDRDEVWVLKGPGRIYSEGPIRVKGNIRLENIQLLSGRDITFEDTISGEGNSAFARGSVFIHDRCRLGVEAVAGKDIVIRDRAQTTLESVLISVGGKQAAKGPDSLNAIRVINDGVARGFLIAGGNNGRVVMATAKNLIEGVVMASAVWLSGEVHGPVLTRKLLCEGSNARNCLGPARILRDRLPTGFVQPLNLGPQDRRRYEFRLMAWRRQ